MHTSVLAVTDSLTLFDEAGVGENLLQITGAPNVLHLYSCVWVVSLFVDSTGVLISP